MTDPVADAARTAAAILAPDLGPSLPAQVEAALAARDNQQRLNRYLDSVSLAGLIVSIATLAWTIYNDQRTRHEQVGHDPEPQPDVIARQVRIILRDADIQLPPGTERITEIIATEVTRQASPPHQDVRMGMDPVTLIVMALAAGAASGLRDDARGAVKTALARLRELARRRFKDSANGQFVLEKHAAAPEIWKPALTQELTESGAAGDTGLLAAAHELMTLLDARGTAAGKYNVSVQNSSGFQIGDYNTQANYFSGTLVGRDAYVAGRDISNRPVVSRSGGKVASDSGDDSGWRPGDGGGNDRGHGGTGGGGHPAEEEPQPRFLTGVLPERAPAGARISLLAQITLAARGASAALRSFPVSPAGAVVTINVSAPGLIPLGDLEQDLTVPIGKDSDPVRFGFLAGPVGLHSVQVRVFAGGTCLGELTLEISVEVGATLEQGRPRMVPLPDVAAEPGEVTLQVSRTAGGGYSFQLLSGTLYPAVIIDRMARDPSEVTAQMIAELRVMSKSTTQYATPALARRRLRGLGSQLWGDIVPTSIREQFWAQRDKIRLFTIASDMDTVPWELLYPVDPGNDNGFLVEQFPVVRRVYGQDRVRVLRLDRGAGFIVPPKPTANALDEVATVRAAFPASVPDRGTRTGLAAVLDLLDADAVPSVLHFAGHNTFTDETGSLITLDGGPLRPSDLSYARQRHAFESARPLVFLNGCRTAGEIPGFTQLIGWASEFMGAGAGAFIGTLWAVRSAAARTFAAEFYHTLVHRGETLGVASLHARQAIGSDEGDPTWLAYTIYGNPAASVTHDPLPPRSSR